MISHGLHNFPIPQRELIEILHDYIDNDLRPIFSLIFYTEMADDVKQNYVRVTCLKCCKIVKNPNFTDSGPSRKWVKKTEYLNLRCTQRVEDKLKKATYFEWINNNNKTVTGYYDFAQLSAQAKIAITNIIFDENHKDIPETFYNCMIGNC